jgi:hypothetical protein
VPIIVNVVNEGTNAKTMNALRVLLWQMKRAMTVNDQVRLKTGFT